MDKEIVGFKASNDHGKTWFKWHWSDYAEGWIVDEPESLSFTTEQMLNNEFGYTKCEPIYKTETMDPKDFNNYSGGAPGSDLEWDRIGREFGVTNHLHFRPHHLVGLNPKFKDKMLIDVNNAAIALGRPNKFRGIEFVHRNWLQQDHASAIYAIGSIIENLDKDFKGFLNASGKQIIAGGTGWAVEMAIQNNKPVFVFDQTRNRWHEWDIHYFRSLFEPPTLTEKFAGIGTRQINDLGKQAITNVYKETFK